VKLRTSILVAAIALSLAGAAAGQPRGKGAPPPPPPTGAPRSESTEELNLQVGANKTYPASDVKNYSEGVPGVADVRLSSDQTQFVVVGQKPGTTTLLLIKKDGSQTTLVINVFSRPPEVVRRELEQLLEGVPGVRLRQVGGRFFIEGGVSTEAEQKRVAQIAALYPGQAESLVAVGGVSAERKFNIRIDLFFAQYDKRYAYGVGISYPARFGGEAIQTNFTYDFLKGSATTAQASVVNQAMPALDIGVRRGWAKVLKQSTVITQNGSEAMFDSGGEQNYPITQGLTSTIYKIPFGINVVVMPRYDPNSRDLEMRVHADVADLVPAAGNTSLPGRNTSKLDTHVHMKLGQSIVLSGIRTSSLQRSTSGLPLLAEIPVLGVFFGSQGWERDDVEGAIFVIPSVVEAVPRQTVDLVGTAMSQYEKYSGDVDELKSYDHTPPPPPPPKDAAPDAHAK
jgi:pilus assembly protein CpaC